MPDSRPTAGACVLRDTVRARCRYSVQTPCVHYTAVLRRTAATPPWAPGRPLMAGPGIQGGAQSTPVLIEGVVAGTGSPRPTLPRLQDSNPRLHIADYSANAPKATA